MCENLPKFDSDHLSTPHLDICVRKYRYGETKYIWYTFEGQFFRHGLVRLFGDRCVRKIIKIMETTEDTVLNCMLNMRKCQTMNLRPKHTFQPLPIHQTMNLRPTHPLTQS